MTGFKPFSFSKALTLLLPRLFPSLFSVSRKRKAKNWEEEDFYDSDDDTFLDRTGAVEKKRLNRMKKAGKIEEKPETFDSLVRRTSG